MTNIDPNPEAETKLINAINFLKSNISNNQELSNDQKKEMVGHLDSIYFSLITFGNNNEERLGFDDYLGEFELEDCAYKIDSKEYYEYLKGWERAKCNPYVLENLDYYR